MSTDQTGHEQNVVNLGIILNSVATFKTLYNPSRNELTIDGLTQMRSDGEKVNAAVTSAENVFKNPISARTTSFDLFDIFITRIINALRISRAPEQSILQAENIVRELRGKRASAKLTNKEVEIAKGEGAEIKQMTLHLYNMDRKIENFNKLVQFLAGIPEYKPNEADLSIAGLNSKLAELKSTTASYLAANAALDAARLERNKVLYAKNTGLVDVALDVKLYVKSVFGAKSPQYKEISDIVFSKLNKNI